MGLFTFVAADGLTEWVSDRAFVLLAIGVNDDGHREVPEMRVVTNETGLA